MKLIIALIAGMLFGGGLVVSGMTDTAKVQGWLDVFGAWDPTLAFVMGGAMIPMAIAWILTKGRSPMTGGNFPAPPEPKLGRNLIVGSVLVWYGLGPGGFVPWAIHCRNFLWRNQPMDFPCCNGCWNVRCTPRSRNDGRLTDFDGFEWIPLGPVSIVNQTF